MNTFARIALFLGLLGSNQVFAADIHCVAILLLDGIDKEECVSADEALRDMSEQVWNETVCNQKVTTLQVDRYVFKRSSESGNLIYNSCEWEVRAPSHGP